jgi:hypothetical protein
LCRSDILNLCGDEGFVSGFGALHRRRRRRGFGDSLSGEAASPRSALAQFGSGIAAGE